MIPIKIYGPKYVTERTTMLCCGKQIILILTPVRTELLLTGAW